eukprot:TRINITY_DN958_c1_g1_i1.p1 TRINITY_DN958_c1_g1~~TRINITY_DN958_c1_g1_i1.p1  ORF type:complete len:228 (+),score=90.56 TRINITY_DN958_c1_g1_i1:130-813(+)
MEVSRTNNRRTMMGSTKKDLPWNKLHLAVVREDFSEVLRILQTRRFCVNSQTHKGNTALHLAVLDGNMDVISLLVRAGADPNARNNEGETPLHFAAQVGEVRAAMFLYQAGADLNSKDDDSLSPIEWAMDTLNPNVACLLHALGAAPPRDPADRVVIIGDEDAELHYRSHSNSKNEEDSDEEESEEEEDDGDETTEDEDNEDVDEKLFGTEKRRHVTFSQPLLPIDH